MPWLRVNLGIFTIESPKTRGSFARAQHILLDERWLLICLEIFVFTMSPTEVMFPSYSVLRTWANELLERFGLQGLGYSLGRLRTGGATFHYLRSFSCIATTIAPQVSADD